MDNTTNTIREEENFINPLPADILGRIRECRNNRQSADVLPSCITICKNHSGKPRLIFRVGSSKDSYHVSLCTDKNHAAFGRCGVVC